MGSGALGVLAGSLFELEVAAFDNPEPLRREELARWTALAIRYAEAERHDEALVIFQDVAARSAQLLGPRDVDTLVAVGNEAATHAALRRWEMALPHLEAVVTARSAVLGPHHRLTVDAQDAYGAALRRAGQPGLAGVQHDQVLQVRRRTLGPQHPHTLLAHLGLGLALADGGDLDAAADVLLTAQAHLDAGTGAPPVLAAEIRAGLADVLDGLGRHQEAAALLAAAADGLAAVTAPNDPDVVALRRHRRSLVEERGLEISRSDRTAR